MIKNVSFDYNSDGQLLNFDAREVSEDGTNYRLEATIGVHSVREPWFGFNYDLYAEIPDVESQLGIRPCTIRKVFNKTIPATYPGGDNKLALPIPSVVFRPMVSFKAPPLAAAPWFTDAQLSMMAAMFRTMPTTGMPMVTWWQESEAGRFHFTPEQVVGAHATVSKVFSQNAPVNAVYFQDLQTWSEHEYGTAGLQARICPGLRLYTFDAYPNADTDAGPDVALDPALAAIRAVIGDGPSLGITECNYTTGSGITANQPQANWYREAYQWAEDNGMMMFVIYAYQAHGVPLAVDGAAMVAVTDIAHASGL